MSLQHQIEETAARWVGRREEPDWSEESEAALQSWLDQSMAHKAAFWRLEHGWRQADRIAALGEFAAPSRIPGHKSRILQIWTPAAIAASLALIFLTIGMQMSSWTPAAPDNPQQRIATRVGGHKVVPLGDGSHIELNTATQIRAAVTVARREVWLDQGEAYFDVKHSDTIPFVVHAGPRTVTVLGTKFSVRRDGDKVVVSVVEGRVRIDEVGSGRPTSSATVVRGDVAITEGPSTLVATRSIERVETGLSWRDGTLSFNQTTLASAAAEFNRYNDRKIIIVDPKVARVRIGGSFQAANVDAFVRLLQVAYGLETRVKGDELQVSDGGPPAE